ncbi:MAG: EipA family protein [Pseudomonadota bacterium]|nr:EipA family protein [Pseudomonadota bacterium]
MGALALAGSVASPAQIQPVDPDKAIDGDLRHPATVPAPTPASSPVPAAYPASEGSPAPTPTEAPADPNQPGTTYHQDDLIGAAEGVFGKGAKGVADVIQNILKKQGEPNAYIVGREGGGALVVGVRYGSGTLFHKVEGQRPVYWTGPSIGFDAGASAGSTFVLVYNLYNTDDLYHRFPAGEGQAYLIGGFNVSYMRRGNIVLIPVRSGVGLRLGVNAGYMKFSVKHKWLPF